MKGTPANAGMMAVSLSGWGEAMKRSKGVGSERGVSKRKDGGERSINRRSFLQLAGSSAGAAALAMGAKASSASTGEEVGQERLKASVFRICMEAERAEVPTLSWDTEGGDRLRTNLLRSGSPLCLRVGMNGAWRNSGELAATATNLADGGIAYAISVSPTVTLHWAIEPSAERLVMHLSASGEDRSVLDGVEIHLPLDPKATPTTLLPESWTNDGRANLPAVLSAPDFGQVLLECSAADGQARLEGDREKHTVDMMLELPGLSQGTAITLSFTPLQLAPPKGLTDVAMWQQARRGWFNTWQPSARWGEQGKPFSAPVGILSNNVISDPVSFALPFYADQALWTPELTSSISVMAQVRRSIDWWLDERTDASGEVTGYWNYRNFLDANPGILISSWDYVEATGDLKWLGERIGQLEQLSKFLEGRDIDGDGMVEATQSGDYNTLQQPGRSSCWWDALNTGYKDGYTNAYIYRAWRCLADMEQRLGRSTQAMHCTGLAERLKAVYTRTLLNPATGWLAWWKSKDGTLHDYASPIVNGLGIAYGLVEPGLGREILKRLRMKMRQVEFSRFDLGLPCTLEPVPRADYLQPDGLGVPSRADGRDTFQTYMNGGISAGHTLNFIMAYHVVGQPEEGDALLRAMLGRQGRIGFQNGVQNQADQGIDWTNWTGADKGYEGYLADVFQFLQAVVLREPALRERLYRPLHPTKV